MTPNWLRGIAGGLRGVVSGMEYDRQRKEEEEQNALNKQLALLRIRGLENDQAYSDYERGFVDDPAESAREFGKILEPRATASSMFSGPTTEGPGGFVGIPRDEPEPEPIDPVQAAIRDVSRPSLRKVGDRYLDPSRSLDSRREASRLRTLQSERSASRAQSEAARSQTRAQLRAALPDVSDAELELALDDEVYRRRLLEGDKPEPPVRGSPEYEAMLDREEQIRNRHREPSGGISPTDIRSAQSAARSAQRDRSIAQSEVDAARVPALDPEEFNEHPFGINMPKYHAAQRRKTADSTVAETRFRGAVEADEDAQARLRDLGISPARETPPPQPNGNNQAAQQEINQLISELQEALADPRVVADPSLQARIQSQFSRDVNEVNARYGIR